MMQSDLAQQKSVRDVLCEQVRRDEMMHGTRLARVRTQHERAQTPLTATHIQSCTCTLLHVQHMYWWLRWSWPAEAVEHDDVGVHVEEVVGVGRVFLGRPLFWRRRVSVEQNVFGFRFIVDTVEARYLQTTQNWKSLKAQLKMMDYQHTKQWYALSCKYIYLETH